MLITSVLLIFTGIVSTQDTPIPSTNVSYYQPTQAPDQSASPSNTSRDWAKHQFVAYITLGVIGIVIVGISVPCLIAWCSGDLKKLEAFCKRRRTRQSGGGDVPDGPTALEMAGIPQEPSEETPCLPSSSNASNPHVPKKRKPKLEDPFEEELIQPVINKLTVNSLSKLFSAMEGLTHQKITKIFKQNFATLSIHDQTENVLEAWIEDAEVSKATRQEICNALGRSGLNNSKQLLEKYWAGKLYTACVAKDARDIIKYGKLAWPGLHKMFLTGLGLEYNFIEVYRGVQNLNVEMSATEVCLAWIDTTPKPTIKHLMIALMEIQNVNAAQKLATEWEIPLKDIEQLKKTK